MTELSDQQIADYRELLLETKTELTELLEFTTESAGVVTLDQSKVGRLSRMDAMQQQQMATANKSAYLSRIKKIDLALQSMAQGDYGYCEGCGEVIHPQRLRIRPESLHCVDCKMACEV